MKFFGFLSALVGIVLLVASVLIGGNMMGDALAAASGGVSAAFFYTVVLFLGGVVFLAVSYHLVRTSRRNMNPGYEIEIIDDNF